MILQTKTILTLFLTSQNGKDQWTNPQHTLEGIQGKGNPHLLLVGLQTDATTMENSQKSKNTSVIKQWLRAAGTPEQESKSRLDVYC